MINLIVQKAFLFSVILLLVSTLANAQIKQSTAEEIQQSINQRAELAKNSFLKNYPVRSIGPVVQGARITDIAVSAKNPKDYYVAYASGGLFRTDNNGITFRPIFDNQGSLTIGDIALFEGDKTIIWIGTGENNSSRSSYSGSGIYKSEDDGKTWKQMGLVHTFHIGKIILHPSNPDIVWVASIGALYSPNEERGVYKTTDGGKTWLKTLFIDKYTGVIDLVINSENPDQLFAASWQRLRKTWHFDGDGTGSSIYVSNDGGLNWTKTVNGFLSGEFTGRIGLAISDSDPRILYALVDNQTEIKKEKDEPGGDTLALKKFLTMSVETFLALNDSSLNEFLKSNDYPEKYDAELVKKEIKDGKYLPKALAEYFGDANKALFETSITGAEIYRSNDQGKSWTKVNQDKLDGVYNTYGYYFGEIRISPDDPEMIYITGVPLLRSEDGGKTYSKIDTPRVHGDHQAFWINKNDPDHLIIGSDGGLYVSYDRARNWTHINNVSVGQFYTVQVDMDQPYNVYGGTQDNGVLKGSSLSRPGKSEHWERIFSGDGMYVAVDPNNSDLVYTGYQFGNYFRIESSKNDYKFLTPQHDIGEPAYRFNWRTPFVMSPHNPDILYMGGNKIFRTLNQGDDWEVISPDLTTNRKSQGNVPYSTITDISESPLKFGLIWVGTDDGLVQLTRDGGATWKNVSKKLPKKRWVSKVTASPHEEGTVFVSLNGFRYDEFKTYVYRSRNYGKSWESIKGDLPDEVVNVIIPDPVNPRLLYIGTDHGTYISMNDGSNWHRVNLKLPNVASYDMIVHPRENELVIATHGRSMYVMDVKLLQQMTKEKLQQQITAFAPKNIKFSSKWGESRRPYLEARIPEITLMYFIGESGLKAENMKLEVVHQDEKVLLTMTGSNQAGFNFLKWDLNISTDDETAKYLGKGKYKIIYTMGGHTAETTLTIK